jgi:3-oxoacyl-[acyl-carrier protein] reductase
MLTHPKSPATDFATFYVGDTASFTRRIRCEDVNSFAKLTGDYNPVHLDAEFAKRSGFQRCVAHGMLTASYVSTLVGMHLPGPGALWTQQSYFWHSPVFFDDEIAFSLVVTHKSDSTRTLVIEVKAVNQHGKTVLTGKGTVMVLEERKVRQDLPLRERVALVTGSSRGIGAAIALALAQAGIRVVVNYKSNAGQAEEICNSIQRSGGDAIAIRADVTIADAVNAMVNRAQQHFAKSVDVLINNATAPVQPRPFLETTWEDMEGQLEVNFRGAYNCCKAVIPAMLEQKSGSIVNIGSINTWNTPPVNQSGYLVAKSALKAFTRCLATELGPKGIRVNMVSPGMTETDLIAEVPERLRKVQAMQTPLRRLALPEDIAQTVVFLCSPGGAFVTGADIPVCGGMSM